jgi:hypothetical protein
LLNSPFKRRAIALASALLTLALGTLLPVLTGPKVATAYINVIWGSIYGLGFWVLSALPLVSPGIASFVVNVSGMIIWPLIVVHSLYKALNTNFIWRTSYGTAFFGVAFLLSALWNVQIGQINRSFIYYMPLYSIFLDI